MRKWSRFILYCTCGFMVFVNIAGCTKKPTQAELTRLEEARLAAEAAQKKLEDLRAERIRLEAELAKKEQELGKNQKELEGIKK